MNSRVHQAAVKHVRLIERTFERRHREARKTLRKHGVVPAFKGATVAGLSTGMFAGPVLAAHVTPAQTAAVTYESSLQQSLITKQAQVAGIDPDSRRVLAVHGPDITLASRAGLFQRDLQEAVPNPQSLLDEQQEQAVTGLIDQHLNIPAKAELEGIRLNAVYGIIAGEQHLPLYPGDTLANHSSDPTKHLTGMVPGLPSWGYFAPSKAQLTQKDIERERYYIAAQTFLAPGWRQNTEKMYQWFKYRKMVMVNPETGQAVVVVIGDGGPSPFTGRTFGGSNEVLIGLGLGLKRTGPVYAFFVDDPEDQIPLGPVPSTQLQ